MDKMEKTSGLRNVLLFFLIFWVLFAVLYLLNGPVSNLMSRVIVVQGEYTVTEQLSKYYLFLTILISVYAYQVVREPIKVKLSICFLIFALILYLSESNMITEQTQPLFGLVILAGLLYWFLKSHAWFVGGLIMLVYLSLTGGVVLDLISENERVQSWLPPAVVNFPNRLMAQGFDLEDTFDVVGLGLLCMAVIVYFLDPVRRFVKNNAIGTFSLLITSGLITAGNSFLHFQYQPNQKIVLVGLSLSLIGFAGLILSNKYLNKKDATLSLISEDFFYIFVFFFFVILPAVFGRRSDVRSLVLWLPTMALLGVYLYLHRPKQSLTVKSDIKF